MLINEYLKEFDFKEYNELKVKGTPGEIYALMLHTDISKSFVIKVLFGLRGMPANSRLLKDMDKLGFIRLDEIV
ncbi:MAG: hypothetical protein WKF91_15795, partial [Segetibacter sp.]